MILLTYEPINHGALTDTVRLPGSGAVVSFLGTVRDVTGSIFTHSLEYEAYSGMAEKQLHSIAQRACSRWPIGQLTIIHRLGIVPVGDISVGVAVSCPHRAEAFAACQFIIDELKAHVPIWKKEIAPDGHSQWTDPGT